MKKILFSLLAILLSSSSVFASSFLDSNCGYDSASNLSCPSYKTLQSQIDTAFAKYVRKYSPSVLPSKLNDLKLNINFKKLELIANQNYSSTAQFLLEYLIYKIDYKLGNTISISDDSSSSNSSSTSSSTSDAKITISQVDRVTSNVIFSAGSSNIYVLKFKITNNSNKDIVFDGFGVNSNGFDSFNLYYDSNKYISSNNSSSGLRFSNVGITVAKNTWKQFELYGYVTSSFNGTVSVSLSNFLIRDNNGSNMNASVDGNIQQSFNITYNGSSSSSSSSSSTTTTPVSSNYLNPPTNIVAGAQDDLIDLGAYKFKIKFMDAIVQNITVVNVGTSSVSEVSASNALSLATSDADMLVSRLYIYSQTGLELGSASLVNGIATFNLKPYIIPVNQEYSFIIKAKLNKVNNTQYDNKPLRLGMLRIGDCVNGMCTKVLFKDTGEMIIPQAMVNYDSKILNAQYIRNSVLVVTGMNQTSSALAGTANLWGFNTTSYGGNSSLKEFRFNVFVYDAGTQGFYVDGTAFSLFINNQRIANSDVKFYSAEGSCNGLNGSQITGQGNLYGTLNSTRQYCVKVVFDGQYSRGYDISQNGKYQFKVYNDTKSVSDDDSITTNMSQYGGYTDMNTYDYLKNTINSMIWSDKIMDNLDSSAYNWFGDAYMGLDAINSWSLRL